MVEWGKMLANSSNTEGGWEEEKINTWGTREIADGVVLIKSKIVKTVVFCRWVKWEMIIITARVGVNVVGGS